MKKKVIAIIVIAAIVAGGAYGGLYYVKNSKTAEVIPVSQLNQEYWGDETTSYGIVKSKDAQLVKLSDGVSITEVHVVEGQEVKVGDPLVTCDGKMSDREYKLQELEVESLTNKVKIAQAELEELQKTKPVSGEPIIIYPEPQEKPAKKTVAEKSGDAYQYIAKTAVPYNKATADGTQENPYRYLCTSDCYVTGEAMIEFAKNGKVVVFEIYKDNKVSETPLSSWVLDGATMMVPSSDTKWSVSSRTQLIEEEEEEEVVDEEPTIIYPEGYTKEELASLISEKQKEIKELDLSKREAEIKLGTMELAMTDGVICATVSGVVCNLQDTETYSPDYGALMEVRASSEMQMTGVINEFMVQKLQPGDYVMLESWNTGNSCSAEITEISDYPTSNAYAYGVDSSQMSYYTFEAAVSLEDGLSEGEYVGVKVSEAQQDASSIYLQKAYVRSEGEKHYVYVRNEENRLEKRYVSTGTILWGEVIEVTDGISLDDYIAFPYGSNAQDGVKTVVADSDYEG